jgi:hypothetical protein
MRRRYDEVPPQNLVVFDGRGYATYDAYVDAFEEFHAAREQWRTQRNLPVNALPEWSVDGGCPWDQGKI